DVLVDVLRRRRLLLVLDNCEHVIEACGTLAYHVLRGCPSVGILVTSRQPLGIVGETIFRVPPLSVPDSSSSGRPERLLACDAIQLFVQRARAVMLAFTLT